VKKNSTFSNSDEKSPKGITSLPESDNSSGKSSFVQNDQDLNAGGEKSDPEEEDDGDDDFSSTQQPEDDFLLTQQPAAPILPAARCIEFNCVSDETQSFKVSTASFGESGERIGRTLGTGTKDQVDFKIVDKKRILAKKFSLISSLHARIEMEHSGFYVEAVGKWGLTIHRVAGTVTEHRPQDPDTQSKVRLEEGDTVQFGIDNGLEPAEKYVGLAFTVHFPDGVTLGTGRRTSKLAKKKAAVAKAAAAEAEERELRDPEVVAGAEAAAAMAREFASKIVGARTSKGLAAMTGQFKAAFDKHVPVKDTAANAARGAAARTRDWDRRVLKKGRETKGNEARGRVFQTSMAQSFKPGFKKKDGRLSATAVKSKRSYAAKGGGKGGSHSFSSKGGGKGGGGKGGGMGSGGGGGGKGGGSKGGGKGGGSKSSNDVGGRGNGKSPREWSGKGGGDSGGMGSNKRRKGGGQRGGGGRSYTYSIVLECGTEVQRGGAGGIP